MADMDFAPSWHQQPGETSKAYHGFQDFLTLPPQDRSMARAYTRHRETCRGHILTKPLRHAPIEWTGWRLANRWQERAIAFDQHCAEQQRLDHMQAIRTMNQRHIELSTQVQQVIANRLKLLLEPGAMYALSPLALARMLETVATIERRAWGEPSEIIRSEDTSTAIPDLSGLTDAELDTLTNLLNKAKAAAAAVPVAP